MTLTRRRLVLLAVVTVLCILTPVVVLGVGRFAAFDIFGQDDPLGDANARIDMIACFERGLDRFTPDDVVDEVLSIPLPDGGFNLPAGVEGVSFGYSDEDPEVVALTIDFYSNASNEDIDRLEAALRDRPEVAAVLRAARPPECAEAGTEGTTSTTR